MDDTRSIRVSHPRHANASTSAPNLTEGRADKSEQTPVLLRKDRRASSSRPSPRERHRSHGRRETEHDDDGYGDERGAPLPRMSGRRSSSKKTLQPERRADSSTSSSSESSIHEHTKPRHILKPPKYDGTGSFETFLAQFQNCATYNKWTKKEQLVYLRSSLEKDAGQVLWDYDAETSSSMSKMMKVLKERFGEANQSDKYRFELKSRRRRPNETLRNLYSDIRRLTALAFPEIERRARETMACDYFIDALDDSTFALKVRERSPRDLDAALRAALLLEVWSNDVNQSHPESAKDKQRSTAHADSDSEQDEVMDSEQSELEELIPSTRLVLAPNNEYVETKVKLSVRESLAARQ